MENRMVRIRSTISGKMVINAPEYRVHVVLPQKNSVQQIPFETLRDILPLSGVDYMFRQGLVYIDNMQDKIDLGLEEPETKEPTNIIVYNDEDIKRLLKTATYEEFQNAIKKVSIDQRKEIAKFAINNQLMTDISKNDFLTATCGINVLSNIIRERDNQIALQKLAEEQED